MNARVAEVWNTFATMEPNAVAAAWDQLSRDPMAHSDRQARLKGSLATGMYEGQTFERWQYEVTSGGRLWYFVDDPTDAGRKRAERRGRGPRPRKRILIAAVHIGHPKATE